MSAKRVAILGAGIMGSSIALFLARRNVSVTLFDAEAKPMSCASRWNEGKIHLGFMYNADPSLATARRMITGGLRFKPVLEDLLGSSIAEMATPADDLYLCHRESVVDADGMVAYFDQVSGLLRSHPDARRYFVDLADCRTRRLDARELSQITDSPEIVAGFRVPERSVATVRIADRIVAALSSSPRIDMMMNARVDGVHPAISGNHDSAWFVESGGRDHGPYDHVINALWQGRLAIDRQVDGVPARQWTHRYRLALFAETTEPVDLPSMVVCTGPFGDVKCYDGTSCYLSWYPVGLTASGTGILPPRLPDLSAARLEEIGRRTIDHLEALLPGIGALRTRLRSTDVRGGWVFAAGGGLLSDPGASLHRRSEFGVFRKGAYLSVDTGKYSTAPWMARRIAETLS